MITGESLEEIIETIGAGPTGPYERRNVLNRYGIAQTRRYRFHQRILCQPGIIHVYNGSRGNRPDFRHVAVLSDEGIVADPVGVVLPWQEYLVGRDAIAIWHLRRM